MLVLASASPRRRELLTQAGFSFQVHPAHIPEDPCPGEDPIAYVTRLAREKAQFVFRELTRCQADTSKAEERPFSAKGTGFSRYMNPADLSRALAPEGTRSPCAPSFSRSLRKGWEPSILDPNPGSPLGVLGADTTVTLDNHILGKPSDPADAARILRLLSGRTHQVITGVALVTPQSTEVAAEMTSVRFLPLSDEEIAAYVATGEPMDKAGAYAIQGRAARWIPRIEGDYFNVVGLPIALVAALLESRHHPATPSC